MGRKPVLQMAGTLLASLALAGCQTSNSGRANNQFTGPSGTTASQSPTSNQVKPAVTTNATMTTSVGGTTTGPTPMTVNGQISGQYGQPNQPSVVQGIPTSPGSQFNQVGQTRPSTPATGQFAIPGNPTPASSSIQPTAGSLTPMSMQQPAPSPMNSSFGASSMNSPMIPQPLPPNGNSMSASYQQSGFAASQPPVSDPYRMPAMPTVPNAMPVGPAINANVNVAMPVSPVGVQGNFCVNPQGPAVPGIPQFQAGVQIQN